jgi:outer membrane protein assembly factor BamB
MRRLSVICAVAGVVGFLGPGGLRAGDWPQWRGPDRTDVSAETGLMTSWPAGGPKQLWLYREAGSGYAGPAIVQGRLFTMGTRAVGGRDQEVLLALSAETGEELWVAPITDVYSNNWGDGPRGTPSVDGELVYALGGQGTLVCVRASDGGEVWRVSYTRDLGGEVPGWGYTESVLVDGDLVVGTPGGSQGTMVALDKRTGKVRWRSEGWTVGAQYSSPIVMTHGGVRQYVQLTMNTLAGVSAADGRVIWRADWPGRTAVIPTPIARDGHVYITSGYSVGCKLVRLGEGSEVETVYENKVMKNHHGGVILVGDHLYGHGDPTWVCQDFMTGKEVWSSRSLGKGAIAYADGRFYCLGEDTGTVVLIEASPKGWNEHGRFTLEPQSQIRKRSGKIWTHPVISNGRLYLRDQELIYCFDVKAR